MQTWFAPAAVFHGPPLLAYWRQNRRFSAKLSRQWRAGRPEKDGRRRNPGGHLAAILRIAAQGPPISAAPARFRHQTTIGPGPIVVLVAESFLLGRISGPIRTRGPRIMGGGKFRRINFVYAQPSVGAEFSRRHIILGAECPPLWRHKCRHIGGHVFSHLIHCPRGNECGEKRLGQCPPLLAEKPPSVFLRQVAVLLWRLNAAMPPVRHGCRHNKSATVWRTLRRPADSAA
jgi:hypothetical protein